MKVMQTQNIAVLDSPNVDILGFNIRLGHIEAVEEDGGMDIYFRYELRRDWVEVAEGGYVVESGYEYHPVNLEIHRIIHEHLGEVKHTYLDEKTSEYLLNFIRNEIYKDSNGIQ